MTSTNSAVSCDIWVFWVIVYSNAFLSSHMTRWMSVAVSEALPADLSARGLNLNSLLPVALTTLLFMSRRRPYGKTRSTFTESHRNVELKRSQIRMNRHRKAAATNITQIKRVLLRFGHTSIPSYTISCLVTLWEDPPFGVNELDRG